MERCSRTARSEQSIFISANFHFSIFMYQISRTVSYDVAYIFPSFSDLRTISQEKKKSYDAQQWRPMPVAHMRLPGVWAGPDSTATAGHSKCLTGFCTWAQRGWGDRQYVGVLLWNVVHGSCKQPLRQGWQMFPNIRLGEINKKQHRVQQMSCVHSMCWTSVPQPASICGLGPFCFSVQEMFCSKCFKNMKILK